MQFDAQNKTKGKNETFLQGILILMFSQIIIKIMGLVQSLYLTNRNGFGDNGNAIYMGSYQIYALLLSVSSIGIPTAISKLVSERIAIGDNNGAHKIFKVAMITFGMIGILGTLLLFFGADAISRYWIEIPESKHSLMILAPAVFFVSIASVFRGYFSGMQKMRATANSQSIEQFLKTIFTIIFVEMAAFYTMNNTTYMAAMATAATSFSILLGFIYLFKFYIDERKYISIVNINYSEKKGESIRKIVKTILWLSIPISLTAILTSVIKLVDSFTVVKILKPILGEEVAKAKYGILSAKADILATLPLSLNVAFTTALVPAISAANAKGDDKTINKRISLSLLLCLIIGLPCTVRNVCVFKRNFNAFISICF
ncbi:MAG: oligosaccharide flippase family protein [Clostridia bacterium]